MSASADLLRVTTAGDVDNGKSTLIGRLLYDSQALPEDQISSVAKANRNGIDFSHFTDGLKMEREQKITVDVAYRHFSTQKRHFILADTPGHEEYIRNMTTGASNSEVAVILLDIQKGLTLQTKRHFFISALLGIRKFAICINKMDLVQWSQKKFLELVVEFERLSSKFKMDEIEFIPVSAVHGENLRTKSSLMSWYSGKSLLEFLESISSDSGPATNLRFPVQYVIRPDADFCGYAGRILSGKLRVGDEVGIASAESKKTRIRSIELFGKKLVEADAPLSVAITLEDAFDLHRGDLITSVESCPESVDSFEATLIWMSEKPAELKKSYELRHLCRNSAACIEFIHTKINLEDFSELRSSEAHANEIVRVSIGSSERLALDPYEKNRNTGSFILIDPMTHETLAAGMIRSPSPEPKCQTFWLTGLSGSGKSTIARELEARLSKEGRRVLWFDGDELRKTLNKDLGFSLEDRSENIRRTAELAKLCNSKGFSVICSLISPLAKDRELAKSIIGDSYMEIFVDTPLQICEARDPKGLYAKARSGEIRDFTGISSPYERPENSELILRTTETSPQVCVDSILNYAFSNSSKKPRS